MLILSVTRTVLVTLAVVTTVGVTLAAEQARKVRIGVSSPSIPAAVARIAKEMGLYEKHNIDANVFPMDNASIATMSLISGSADFSTSGATDLVVSQARGQKLVAVTSVYRGFAAVLVLSKAVVDKLGISPTAPVNDRLKALDGLVIASPSSTSTFTFGLKAAEALDAKVRVTFMSQPAMVAALETGAIQGFLASSPYYAVPVIHGSGVIWINGPKGEFPPDYSPANVTLNTTRAFADANPDLMRDIAGVFADFAIAVKERPSDVKAAIAKLYPDLDAQTLDLLFETEAGPFQVKPITVSDMAHEIAFVKLSGAQLPQLDSLDPRALLYP